ncbi:5-oxoprolinase subunit B family protein [Saccharopolyspora sp. NPDC002376]
MRVLRCADSGLLVELDDLDAVSQLYDALVGQLPDGVIDVVPAARTLLLRLDPVRVDVDEVEQAVRAARPVAGRRRDGGLLRVPVIYDGADLADIADRTGLTVRGVIEAHTATEWTVAFGGFAPGFGYLVGGDGRLQVPRNAESRTKVPAGAVGLAGLFTGVYPRESPGGWRLLGHTEKQMWNIDRDPPALLRPGVRVRFEEVDP